MFNNAITELRPEQQKQVSQILGMTGHLQVVNNMSKIIPPPQKKSPFFSFLVLKKTLSSSFWVKNHSSVSTV